MKTEQKQLLNEICEANGFRIVSEADDTFHIEADSIKYVMADQIKSLGEKLGYKVTLEKNVTIIEHDEWEGVRFSEFVGYNCMSFTNGKIYRLRDGKDINDTFAFIDNEVRSGGWSDRNKSYFKPSTEEAYKSQLIKEAKDRFGEIKKGDKFASLSSFSDDTICRESDPENWTYYKGSDSLYIAKKGCGGACIYKEGKWAERVKKEPICIKNIEVGSNTIKFEINREYINPKSEGPMEKQNFLKAIEDVCKEYLK